MSETVSFDSSVKQGTCGTFVPPSGTGKESIRAGLGDKSDLMSVSPIFLPHLNTTKEGSRNKWVIVLVLGTELTSGGLCCVLSPAPACK